jgi:N6-adenosine-specific RNA methylase IME4
MTTDLIKYDAACRAIAEAKSVDEVKEIRDVAIAMKAYARQAKNKDMEADAAEIRMRATRRLDQMRQAQKATVGLASGGDATRRARGIENPERKPTLADAGIDKNLAKEGRKLGALSDPEFEAAVVETRKAVVNAAKTVIGRMTKASDRAGREAELGEKIRSAKDHLGDNAKFYGVILADPPWQFEPYSRESGMDRAADNHYPTSPANEFLSLKPRCAKDAVLFLWATVPMLPDALWLLEGWGFSYRSHLAWAKDRTGTGYWARNRHELLLIGTQGKVPAPAPGEQPESVIHAPAGRHSEKPAVFYEIIERMFPSLPKLEMFARAGRAGWDQWGAEAPEAA